MFFSSRRSNYMVIDGDDEEDPMVRTDPGPSSEPPPHLYDATEVSFQDSRRASEFSKSTRRWDHIEDIDQFFSLVYEYHRGNGFLCITLKHLFALFQFIFVVSISTFFLQCIDYDVLFNNSANSTRGTHIVGKRHLSDAVVPQCTSHFHPLVVLTLVLAAVFWVVHLMRVGYRLLQLSEIQKFFHTVLDIPDRTLANVPWREVVRRVCRKQPEVHLIVNQEEITVLDVYQRILRYKNYMIAMVDHNVLPLQIALPFVGPADYLSSGLRLNLDWLFFRGPWAPWKGHYALKDEFKDPEMIPALAAQLRTTITYMGLANLVLFPFVFIYQVLFSFFSYADLMRRDPGVFGSRKYSNYARLRLRHYNELDHELSYRLNRSYEYAVRYMDQFVSPTLEIVAKAVAFASGSLFAILFLLSAWDEDVLNVEHVFTVMTACGAVALLCRAFIPNENVVLCQTFLMKQIVASVHYAPAAWLRDGPSTEVCAEFSRLFQLKVYFLVEELLSPLVTPFVLLFSLRPRAEALVQFFHEHTRYVEGIGDVCDLALMEPAEEGAEGRRDAPTPDPHAPPSHHLLCASPAPPRSPKPHLSLLSFATQHPGWRPPPDSENLIQQIRGMWAHELGQARPADGADLTASMRFGPAESALLASLAESRQAAERERHDAAPSTPPPSPAEAATRRRRPPARMDASAAAPLTRSMHESAIAAPVPRYLPVNERARENQDRALEMSLNALALTSLLQTHRQPATATATPYGGTVPTSAQTPFRPFQAPPPADARPNPAASNIWGVPEQSLLLNDESAYNNVDSDLEDLDERPEEETAPNAFNV